MCILTTTEYTACACVKIHVCYCPLKRDLNPKLSLSAQLRQSGLQESGRNIRSKSGLGVGKDEVMSCPRFMECIETKESVERVCDAAKGGGRCVDRSEVTHSWLPGRRAS